MEKEKPRKDVVLDLMKSTYYSRRKHILGYVGSVSSKVTKYPAFKMPSVLEQEMDLVLTKQGVYHSFTEDFTRKWAPAILTYSKGSKWKDIKAMVFRGGVEDNRLAVMCLFHLLCVQSKKKDHGRDFEKFLKEYDMAEDPEVAATMSVAEEKGPRIGRFTPDDGDEEFYIFVENLVLCKVNSFVTHVFVVFFVLHLSSGIPIRDKRHVFVCARVHIWHPTNRWYELKECYLQVCLY